MRKDIGERGIHELYKFYKTTVDNPVEFKMFKAIICKHNRLFMDCVLEYGDNVRLPNRLGYIRVKKTKMDYKNLMFDYGTYHKTGLKTFHLNEHSDDFKARLLWNKSKCIVAGKRPWSFTPSRENSRRLSSNMQESGGHTRYKEEL